MGVTDNLCKTLCRSGLSEEQARKRFWLIDKQGLLTENVAGVTDSQLPYLRKSSEIERWQVKNKADISLLEVIKHVKPTILFGCSARAGAFNKKIVKTMAKYVEQPVIFPLSNPTEKSEAKPEDLLKWTNGKALIATGSPFEDVDYHNQLFPISQCNNYLAFPGIGLGVISVKPKYVTDNMLWSASKALSRYADTHTHCLLPRIEQAHEASRNIAIAVAQTAVDEGVATIKTINRLRNLWTKIFGNHTTCLID